jgi:DNA-binding MurR/RpiR family transcriptional regulator
MSDQNIFHTLNREYYQFTSAEKKVADYVVSNSGKARGMSISELAAASGVAEATISRFCRRLSYNGYAAFKMAIATPTATREISNPLSGEVGEEDSIPELAKKLAGASVEAILETESLVDPEVVEQATELLTNARQVLCMGQGGSMVMAQEAAHLFGSIFPGYFPVSGSHMQLIYASQLCEEDVILYFGYSGTTTGLMDVLNVTRENGAKVILITRYPNSPAARQADVVLQCGSTESPLQLGSVPARMAQIYLMDVLFSEICRKDLEACRQRRAKVADILSEKYI